MTLTNTITICSPEERTAIVDSMNDFNLEHIAPTVPEHWIRLEYVTRNEHGKITGGILALLGYWGGLEIQVLWVDEEHRNKGLGTQLLRHVEQAGISQGATLAVLDTFDFQAKHFYLKNGYRVFGELEDFPKGHNRYYLSKKLEAACAYE